MDNTSLFKCLTDETIPIEWGVKGLIYRNFKVTMHIHEYYEINVIYSGEGVHTVSDEKYNVSRGDVFMIPPYLPHGYSNTKNLDVYHLVLHPDFLKQYLDEAMSVEGFTLFSEIEPYLRGNTGVARFLRLNEQEFSEIRNDLHLIDSGGRYTLYEAVPLKKHVALKVLYQLSMMLSRQTYSVSPKRDIKYSQQIMQTLEYIHTNFDKKLTVDELAKRVFLSRSSFIRSFEAVCNIAPAEYIRTYRRGKAIEYLKSDVKRSEIAQMCGYYDTAHMIHALKK